MTLIKELIEIPERVQKGDFVLRLTEGVTKPEETLKDYVFTPELVKHFDEALSFIRSSLEGRSSKASYLHGSFGSGKSHFMAVLHLILQGNVEARSVPELAAVITKHNAWIAGKKFLLVPYHMIGAHDMESGILGGYVDFIRRTHPKAPIPGVYLAEGLFEDAQKLRAKFGDEQFFAVLGAGAASDEPSPFGDVDAGWTAERFENAVIAPPGSEERSQLIGALIDKYFGSYDTQAGAHGEAFLSLDKGLSVLSQHARSLGYDGLILFLDELILWLASRAADLNFVHQEGQKLAKLVEAQAADRPIPIISFIARQRDLSELIGDSVPGAQRVNFSDALKHWEGRFHTITLEDRNLPAIAEKRVLKCKTPSARAELDASFTQVARMRDSVMNMLLTSEGDREMFRKVYPFSPALVQTLIAVSSVLQRERTALKVMLQLLVDQREVLQVGDLVPVGDLFDVIAHGDEAFSQDMAIHFDNAKRLYHQKLLPMLERQHGRREELEAMPLRDPRRKAFRDDDRLVKTLLLSALVPEVESLRGLNAERLAALNYGTIKTPIPGREGPEVLRRCRNWAAGVGEIRIGEGENPTISVQLSGVDTDSILAQALREDNTGNQVRRVRQMLFEQLGVEGESEFEHYHDFTWKNTQRTCTVLFRNVRELSDNSFDNDDEDPWKLIIDFPFDQDGFGPRDDLSKVKSYGDTHITGAKTLCWLPQFFSADAKRDLGTLVVIEHVLTGERFGQYTTHLSPQDRQAAKSLLENQRSVLRQRVENHLQAAYGLDSISAGSLSESHQIQPHEQFTSLWSGFTPQPPVGAGLRDAMHHLLGQALEFEYPAAPDFGADVKTGNLKKVHAVVSEATQTPDGRVLVDKTLRPLVKAIANPLKLGEMGHDATHFVLGHHWRSHFERKQSESGGTATVEQLRNWINHPQPMGLPKEAENLVILTFAEQTNRTFTRHGGPFSEPTLSNLPNDCVLFEPVFPSEADWKTAIDRAASIFGKVISPHLNAGRVAELQTLVTAQCQQRRAACHEYCQSLKTHLERLGIPTSDADRLKTATATLTMVEQLNGAGDDSVELLARMPIATSEAAMGECLTQSGKLTGTLAGTNWEIFESIRNLPAPLQSRAVTILDEIRTALLADEHVVPLSPTLTLAQSQALRLITDAARNPDTPTPAPPGKDAKSTAGSTPSVASSNHRDELDIDSAKKLLEELQAHSRPGDVVRLSISWTIDSTTGGQ